MRFLFLFGSVIIEFNNRKYLLLGRRATGDVFSGGWEFEAKLDLDPYRGIIIVEVQKIHTF